MRHGKTIMAMVTQLNLIEDDMGIAEKVYICSNVRYKTLKFHRKIGEYMDLNMQQ